MQELGFYIRPKAKLDTIHPKNLSIANSELLILAVHILEVPQNALLSLNSKK